MSDTDHATFNTVIETEDHTGNLLPEDQRDTGDKNIREAQELAKANHKAEQKANTSVAATSPFEGEHIDDAQKLAELNHKVDTENAVEGHEIAKNDTSKAGKTRTSKSQLDPTGNDPITNAEVTRAATDGRKVKGETSVSDQDVADRAAKPGEAEETNPISTARDGVDSDKLEATADAKHANGNENENTGEGGMADIVGPANRSVEGRNTTSTEEDTPDENTSTDENKS